MGYGKQATAKRDDKNIGRMMACLARIDANQRYTELIEAGAAVHRLIKSERDIGVRAKMIQFVDECDAKLKFWSNRPDFDITVVHSMRAAKRPAVRA
jgi:hypothetical protein